MKRSFLPGAETAYLDAIRFYEERRPGLGAALIAEFEHALGQALGPPQTWRQIHPSGIRRIGLSRFPYTIFFRILEDNLQITALAHNRKRPGYWLSRLDDQG